MSWFPCDTDLAHDNKIALLAGLGDPEWGPKAIAAWVTLLGLVQEKGEAGAAFVAYRPFAALAYLDSIEAHRLIRDMENVGLITISANDPDSPLGGASVTVNGWKRYRERVFNAQRQAKSRARKQSQRDGPVTQRDSALPRSRGRERSRGRKKTATSRTTDVPLLRDENPVVQTVVARFEEAATANPSLDVQVPNVVQVLHDFEGMSGLKAEAIHCAEWLGAQNGRKRRVAHLTLRNWLKKTEAEQPKGGKRERSFKRTLHTAT